MANELLTQQEIEALVDANMKRILTMDDVRDVVADGKIPKLAGTEAEYGKVRANFHGERLIMSTLVPLRPMITTDAVSTHDSVRGHIPFKGQVLNGTHNYWVEVLNGLVPMAQISAPGPNVTISEQCQMLDFEMIVRRYFARSSTSTNMCRQYMEDNVRNFCGHVLPEGMKPNQLLPYLMDTPSTKARDGGHDVSVSREFLFENGLVKPGDYIVLWGGVAEAFGMSEALLVPRRMIHADTKYEIGKNSEGRLVLADEIHTPDASRYWFADTYEQLVSQGKNPDSLSKEVVRAMGESKGGEAPPPLTDAQRREAAIVYIKSYQQLTGRRFEPDMRDPKDAVIADANAGLEQLLAA
jgi:phosphoribosylaminoimidazole-succinocarboxamide synthase